MKLVGKTPSGDPRLTYSQTTYAWRGAVTEAATRARTAAQLPTIAGPCSVSIVFSMPRPAGHHGKRGLLPSAPGWPHVRPDLDKLTRAVFDALTDGAIWTDDCLVVALLATKRYADTPDQVGAHITITNLEGTP